MRRAMVWTAALLLLAAGCSGGKKGEVPARKAGSISGPVVACRVDPDAIRYKENYQPKGDTISDYEILDSKAVSDEDLAARIRSVLDDPGTYGGTPVKCFEPGMAFRIGEGTERTDYLICLRCRWLHVILSEKIEYFVLTPGGVEHLRNLYKELFPDAGKTEEAKDAKEAEDPKDKSETNSP